MIKEAYVSFEIAKLLKEKGFDALLTTCYTDEEYPQFMDCVDYLEQGELYERSYGGNCHLIQAPSLAMAMKWLREVHGKIILINFYRKERYSYDILLDGECGDNYIIYNAFMFEHYQSYEEAVEAALKYCLTKLI